jgi:hypothetical protein
MEDRGMTEPARNFMVGAASIVALLAISGLLFFFGELDPLLHARYPINVALNDAGGVRPGSVIELSGVPVGLVEALEFRPDAEYPVLLRAQIEGNRRIPARAAPAVIKPLIGGASVLHLAVSPPIPGDAPGDLPTDGTGLLRGRYRSIAEEIVTSLDERMKPVLASLETFHELSDTYITLGRNLNGLVQPQDEQALQNGEAPNLRTTVARLFAAVEEGREALALARAWLGDEPMRTDAREALRKANQLIDTAAATFDRYSALAGTLETSATDLVHHLLPVTDELAATLEEVRRLTRLATEGQGSIAQLLGNPDLYNALTEAAIRLEKSLVDAQLLIQKIKAEGLPVRY